MFKHAVLLIPAALAVASCAPKGKVTNATVNPIQSAKCKPELSKQITTLRSLQSAKPVDNAAVVAECDKLSKLLPENFNGCVLDNGELAPVEAELKLCEDAKNAKAEAPPLPSPEPKTNTAQQQNVGPQTDEQNGGEQKGGTPVQPDTPAYRPRTPDLGVKVLVDGKVGEIGTKPSRGRVSVAFSDTYARTAAAEAVPLEGLETEQVAYNVNACGGRTLWKDDYAVINGQPVKVLAMFANGKAQVQSVVESDDWLVIARWGRDVELGQTALVDLSSVTATSRNFDETVVPEEKDKCVKGICVGDKVKAARDNRDLTKYDQFIVTRLFCDGTSFVQAYDGYFYDELIFPPGTISK